MSKKRRPSAQSSPLDVRATSPAAAAIRPRAPTRSLGWGALVLGATAVAYLPALTAGFIWNDSDYVTAPALQSLTGLGRIWSEIGATEQYYPLLHSLFWLQHMAFGDHPAGYHVVNLLLHLGAVALFVAVLKRLLDRKYGSTLPSAAPSMASRSTAAAWLAGALFALHPVHVATVAWITEQKNTFSLVLYLAAFLVYLRFDETRRARDYAWALVWFGLSMFGKTATVTLPAALLVVFWWQRGRLEWKRDVRPLLPWLMLGAAAGIFSSWVERNHLGGAGLGAKGAEFDLSAVGHVLLASRAIWFYLGSLVWPFDLNFIYPRWTIDAAVAWQWLFPLALLAALAALWLRRSRHRAPLAVLLLFAGTLFPVLGFVNLFGALYSRVWDHWQYLADLAPLALLGVALARAGDWAGPRFRRLGPAVGVAGCVVLGVLTWQRCHDFQNDETLYRTTLARNPACWMAHNNLGQLLATTPAGLPEAIEHYAAAVRLHPTLAELHYNLANALAKSPGRETDAAAAYATALQLAPDYAAAHNGLGNVLARLDGRLPDAIAHYEAAVQIMPAVPDYHNNLGIALLMSDRAPEAIPHFAAAVRADPNNALVHCNLGAALQSLGRRAEAKTEFETALRLRPDLAQVRAVLDQLNEAP